MVEFCQDLFKCFLLGTFLALIALITTIGNLIVIFAFYFDQKLRTINDYFILNMAIADFLVGCFCIPFYIPFSVGNVWPFGRIFCQIWVTIDDVATMASVINIVAITINRYWLIAYPISYRKYIKQRFVYFVMAAIWILSFLNFGPGIWLINLFESIEYNANDCSGDYNRSFVYMFIAQLNYFVIPFVFLCLFNMLILLNIWKRTKNISKLKSNQFQSKRMFLSDSSPIFQTKRSTSLEQPMRKSFKLNVISSRENSSHRSIANELPEKTLKIGDLRIKRDRKAARSLFILVLVFLIFLFPYVICATATTAGLKISSNVFQISFWLLWMNSTFNPFLYPFIQNKYRRAYVKLFQSYFKCLK